MHNEELHNVYASPNIIKVIKSRTMKWARNVARVRDEMHRVLVRKLEWGRPLGKQWRTWENIIKRDLTGAL